MSGVQKRGKSHLAFVARQYSTSYEDCMGRASVLYLPIIKIKTVEEGIKHYNSSNNGLQGCDFTKDINKAILISNALGVFTVFPGVCVLGAIYCVRIHVVLS